MLIHHKCKHNYVVSDALSENFELYDSCGWVVLFFCQHACSQDLSLERLEDVAETFDSRSEGKIE